jgi:hypothetical protein
MGLKNKTKVQVDSRGLEAHLHDFSVVMGRSLGEVVQQQAGLFCTDMLKYSRPFDGKVPGAGLSSGAKQHGMENVNNSLLKVFRPISYATGSQIANLDRYDVFKRYQEAKGTASKGKALKMRWTAFKAKYGNGNGALPFVESGDLGTMARIHSGLREDGGHGGLKNAARNSKEPFALVADDKTMKAYILQKQRDVGILKSGYWHAAKLIRAKVGGGSWVQHPEGSSQAIGINQLMQAAKPEVTVGNKIGGKAGNGRFVQLAINHRAFAMRNAMLREMKKQQLKGWQQSAAVLNSYQYFQAS